MIFVPRLGGKRPAGTFAMDVVVLLAELVVTYVQFW